MIFDTNILIKLERETRRGKEGAAIKFLNSLPATRMCITPTIAGEFACGASMANYEKWLAFLSPFEVLPITQDVTWQYGQIYQQLASVGELIGTNDMWIAATAIAHSVPVATGNIREFSRVKGLEVVSV